MIVTFKGLAVAAMAGACLIAVPVRAEAPLTTKDIPVTGLFPFLQQYYDIPPAGRDRFHLVYLLAGDAPQSFHAVLKRKSGEVPIAIGQNGVMTPIPTAEDVAAKTKVSMTASKGIKLGVSIRLAETIEPARVMDARGLKAGLDQARAGVKKAAGLMAMATPDYQKLCFEGAVSGQVVLANGKIMAMKTDAKSAGHPCYRPNDYPTAAQVNLAQLPKAVFIEPK